MQTHDRINALTERAALLNLSLWRVCKLAGVDYSTVTRWRNSECNPTIVRFAEITTKVERQIQELEYDMAAKLIDRINPAAWPHIAELLRSPAASESGTSSPVPEEQLCTEKDVDGETVAEDCRRHGPDRAA